MDVVKEDNKEKGYDLFLMSRYRNEIYGLSALWIALYHAFLCGCSWQFPFRILRLGIIGVEIFLFLSGISLYFSFSKDKRWIRFYKKRLIRLIVPTIVLCPVYISAISSLSGGPLLFAARFFLRFSSVILWLRGDSSFWYISMIVAVSLLYPVFYQVIFYNDNPKEQLIRTVILCLMEAAWALFLSRKLPGYYNLTRIAWTRFPVFTIGCYMGRYVYEHHTMRKGILFFSMTASVLSITVLLLYFINPGFNVSRIILYSIAGISLCVVFSELFSLMESSKFEFLLRFFSVSGKMSFEIYFINILLIRLYKVNIISYFHIKMNFPLYIVLIFVTYTVSFIWNRINRKMITAITRWIV